MAFFFSPDSKKILCLATKVWTGVWSDAYFGGERDCGKRTILSVAGGHAGGTEQSMYACRLGMRAGAFILVWERASPSLGI